MLLLVFISCNLRVNAKLIVVSSRGTKNDDELADVLDIVSMPPGAFIPTIILILVLPTINDDNCDEDDGVAAAPPSPP